MAKVTQLVGMELEFEPRQSDTTACARNHFSTWPPKECQVTLSKVLPTHPPPKKQVLPRGGRRAQTQTPLLPLDIGTRCSLGLKHLAPRLCPDPLLFTLWTLTFRKCHFLRDIFFVLPRPSRSIYKFLLHDVPSAQGIYHIVMINLTFLHRFSLPTPLPHCP